MTARTLQFVLLLAMLLGTLSVFAQKKSKIDILNAQTLEGTGQPGVDKLKGNCIFKQDNVLLYCDSAYLYSNTNSVDAFGHVHMAQGDTVNLYGDIMKYNGNTKLAVVLKNVQLIDRDTHLKTQKLDYDLNADIASYTDSAYITDKENVLTSRKGYYHSNTKQMFFRERVVLTNPQYVMHSDTLMYNTITKTSYFYGPTTITSKEDFIFCERGWYNTFKGTSKFWQRAFIQTKSQTIAADTLLYNRKTGYGRGIKHVSLNDTAQKIIVTGNIGHFYRTNQLSIVTDSALMTRYMDKDTLYIHADTLKSDFDSVKNERKLYAYHKVKIFKRDMQGRCDSLFYSSIDSTMRMYTKPILWSAENQITGRFITLKLKNKQMNLMNVYTNTFMASKVDSLRYNQIKGKNMTGYFADNKLYKVKVEGNGQSIYYGKNKKEQLVGVNRAECSDMMIYIKDNKVQRITLLNKPEATFYPMKELKPQELLLKDFKWFGELRPATMEDVFKKD